MANRGLSASGLPNSGDSETDEVLDDPELTRRLLLSKADYEGPSDDEIESKIRADLATGRLIPLERIKATYGITD
ncbi:MAG TPA: hypothetical protein VF171_03250 [Trueperaceae bacterium]